MPLPLIGAAVAGAARIGSIAGRGAALAPGGGSSGPAGGVEPGIRTEGLAEFRRDLRKLDKLIDRGMRDEIKDAADDVASEGRRDAPRSNRALGPGERHYADTIRPYVSGARVSIGSTHPGAGVIHFGGTIRPQGVPITFKPRPTVSEAVDEHADGLVEAIGDAVERAAYRAGWHPGR